MLSSDNSTHILQTFGGSLVLSCHKTAFDPLSSSLFVADVHLGKAATFRSLGVPVPAGTTHSNLERLTVAIEQFQAKTVFFLGDLFHAKAAHNQELLQKLYDWRTLHCGVEMTLIRGNHDTKAGDPPEFLNIALVEEPFIVGGFALCHHPQLLQDAFVLAGHLHPVVVLTGKARSRVRLPCFHLQARTLILPSFGEFTGGHAVKPKAAEMVFPVQLS